MAAELDFADRRDFEEAARGLTAPLPDDGKVLGADGAPVWDLSRFAFIHGEAQAPDTVNPSLWRQMQLTVQGGLYEVVPGLYQVRTLDLSNSTIAEGDDGLVVFDPLISTETARAALELYYAHRPRKPVAALVYSHSHVDHYGGARGIIDEADVRAGNVRVFAPVGFLDAAVAENVLAGNVMSRRASYMYGNLLPADPKGQVGAGLGVTTRHEPAEPWRSRGPDAPPDPSKLALLRTRADRSQVQLAAAPGRPKRRLSGWSAATSTSQRSVTCWPSPWHSMSTSTNSSRKRVAAAPVTRRAPKQAESASSRYARGVA